MKKTNMKNVIVGAGVLLGVYILGKTNGVLKALEDVDRDYGSYFPKNTEVKVKFNNKFWAMKLFNEGDLE